MLAAGMDPFVCFWTKDGMPLDDGDKYRAIHTTNPLINRFDAADAGGYQVVLSNAFGMATSLVAQVAVHCVDAGAGNSAPPFSSWATASSNIQAAIDVASIGDVVLVTNGTYAAGGKVMAAGVTNRIAVDKPLTVMSVNGWSWTTIRGAWDPAATNGPSAVRCAWLGDRAILNGFTLRNGATPYTGDAVSQSGAGVWCATTNALVANCQILGNQAAGYGGGVYQGTVNNCLITGNAAATGGGVAYAILNNCALMSNAASLKQWGAGGGGGYWGTMRNCTVIGNSAPLQAYGGGVMNVVVRNCIIQFNNIVVRIQNIYPDGEPYSRFCCTTFVNPSQGNINVDPQLVDPYRVSVTSPCRGMGSTLYASGVDMDGESWLNPPTIGCDELVEAALGGALGVTIESATTEVLVNRTLPFTGHIDGRAARLEWSFGDGPAATNVSFMTTHAWTNAGDYTVTFTAYNSDNPGGVSTNLLVHVLPLIQPIVESTTMTTNGFRITFASQAGATYVTEVATNLTAPILWQPLNTSSGSGGVMTVTDPASTNAARFYRVRVQ
jgi:hypothetical protein